MNNNRKELELPFKPFNEIKDAFMNRAIFLKDLKPTPITLDSGRNASIRKVKLDWYCVLNTNKLQRL